MCAGKQFSGTAEFVLACVRRDYLLAGVWYESLRWRLEAEKTARENRSEALERLQEFVTLGVVLVVDHDERTVRDRRELEAVDVDVVVLVDVFDLRPRLLVFRVELVERDLPVRHLQRESVRCADRLVVHGTVERAPGFLHHVAAEFQGRAVVVFDRGLASGAEDDCDGRENDAEKSEHGVPFPVNTKVSAGMIM